MFKVVKQCVPWLNWKLAGVAVLGVVGLMLCTKLPALSILAGGAPLLVLVACLVPCLLPLALVRGKGRDRGTVQLSEQHAQATESCGCGQNACEVGEASNTCKGQHHSTESART